MKEHYELLYIVPIKFLDNDLQKVVADVNGLINKFGGTITKEDNLGKQKLAYPINNVHQGTYILVEYDMETENNEKFGFQMKLHQEVLRHMVIVKRIKSNEELAREAQIQDGIRKSREDELTEIEEKEKEVIVKKDKPIKKITKKVEDPKTGEIEVETKKATEKSSLEELDKKLDEILTDDIL